MTITFTTPMDADSVAALTTVSPPTQVDLAWDAAGRTLTISPRVAWAPSAYHTITVAAGALALSGQPLLGPVRTGFLTRGPSMVGIAATKVVGSRVSASTAFEISFDRPIDPTAATAGIRLEPDVPGMVAEVGAPGDGTRFRFTPASPLRADTRYRLVVAGLVDAEGGPVAGSSKAFRTASAPAVVRFRPRDGTLDVARDATLSVRFTVAMDRPSTKAAFTVTVNGKPIKGAVSFAEGDQVLVFEPAARCRTSTKVAMTDRRHREGGRRDAGPVQGSRPVPNRSQTGSTEACGRFGTVRVQRFRRRRFWWRGGRRRQLGLRRDVLPAADELHPDRRLGHLERLVQQSRRPERRGRSSSTAASARKVSRPYAKKLAVGNVCSHFIGGNPGDRLRAAGYTSYTGPRTSAAARAIRGARSWARTCSSRSEKSYNGGHYVNMMNAEVRPGRDRRVGLVRPGPPGHRLLPPLTGPSAG